MLDLIAKIFQKEALQHPLFFLLCFVAAGVLGGLTFNPFVMAETFEEYEAATRAELSDFRRRLSGLESGVCSLQYTTQKSSLEQAIRATEAEIFQLERVESAREATERDLMRLDALRTEKGRLSRELQELQRRANCEGR